MRDNQTPTPEEQDKIDSEVLSLLIQVITAGKNDLPYKLELKKLKELFPKASRKLKVSMEKSFYPERFIPQMD